MPIALFSSTMNMPNAKAELEESVNNWLSDNPSYIITSIQFSNSSNTWAICIQYQTGRAFFLPKGEEVNGMLSIALRYLSDEQNDALIEGLLKRFRPNIRPNK